MAYARTTRVGIAAIPCLLALGAISVRSTAADTVVYSNTTNPTGFGYANGGAAPVGPSNIDYTQLVADDITPIAGFAGDEVTSITFSIANLNGGTLSVNPHLRFYASDGVGGGPGTLLATDDVGTTSASVGFFTVTSTGFFALPSTSFWAGISFDNDGTSTTIAQLNDIGQSVVNPPTVGSSTDAFWSSDTVSQYTSDNPSGGFYFFGGNPVANFGWSFSVTPVPEPASLGLLGAGCVALLARRRK